MAICFNVLITVMTPELRSACELVFLEHKISSRSINWGKNVFHGRLSLGMSEMAKLTLIDKKIIYLPNPEKKKHTLLNPIVATAANFEEAEELIQKGVPELVANIPVDRPTYINHTSSRTNRQNNYMLLKISGDPAPAIAETKWHMGPLFRYFVLLVGALIAGVLITWLISFVSSELFFRN